MDNFEQILKAQFIEEAEQFLSEAEQCYLVLETNPEDEETLNKIFRIAHNLKGSSKAVGFSEISHFTHELENFILLIKNKKLKLSQNVMDLLLKSNDFLIQHFSELKSNVSAVLQTTDLIDKMKLAQNEPQEVLTHFGDAQAGEIEPNLDLLNEFKQPTEIEAVEVNYDLLNEIKNVENTLSDDSITPNLDLLNELNSRPTEVAITKNENRDIEINQATEELNRIALEKKNANSEPVVSQNVPAATAVLASKAAQPAISSSGANEETLRISVKKLENLLNYVGEMVILQSVMKEQVLNSSSILMKKTVNQIGKVSKEIQDLTMSLRMVPIRPTFQKMQRIVRDTSQALSKEIIFNLVGEDTELDKTVLEKINDPLVHLIRNSADHGIEKAEDRVAKGKTAKGTVTLSAFHQSGKLIIEVKDDGGGLNAEKLKAKAIEKGIIKKDAALSEKDAYNLIFAPGFSTKEKVTDVSGRGVGMDVVRTNIKELSGEIQIYSELNKGTTFRIILPLTLAIIDGMVVSFNSEKFVIPLIQVHETLRPNENQIQYNQTMGNVLMLRGENIPLFKLGDFFNLQNKTSVSSMIALVFRTSESVFSLLVDDIIGQYQVVVKQLSSDLQNQKGISGSTILGDGRPSLILEPVDIIKRSKSTVPLSFENKKITHEGKAA